MRRHSYRVNFPGHHGLSLAGIVDRPVSETPHQDASTAAQPVEAPVLVLSHCFTCNKDLKAIVRLSRSLAEHGVAVLRFDMAGLGGSEGEFADTNFTTNCEDLRAAIQFANKELGPVAALLGHSFGGAASLKVASEKSAASEPTATQTSPEKKHSPELNSSELDLPGFNLSELKALITLASPSDTAHLSHLLAGKDPRIERDGEGEVSIGGRTWTIRREMLADFRSHRLTDDLPKIEIPTFIFHSPTDETVHYDHALRLKGLIGENASLISLPDADHLLTRHPGDQTFVAHLIAAMVHRYTDKTR